MKWVIAVEQEKMLKSVFPGSIYQRQAHNRIDGYRYFTRTFVNIVMMLQLFLNFC